MTERQMNVVAIGKISDIFAHRGITTSTKATGLPALLDATIEKIKEEPANTLIFTNLVNFDQDFGHRRDPTGYADALTYFDQRLADVTACMTKEDLLIITADHGCDPTWIGSDHTREYIPILAYRHGIESIDLGARQSFSDIGQTLADFFELPPLAHGKSFLDRL
jgi:phosphopentomutase